MPCDFDVDRLPQTQLEAGAMLLKVLMEVKAKCLYREEEAALALQAADQTTGYQGRNVLCLTCFSWFHLLLTLSSLQFYFNFHAIPSIYSGTPI